MNQALSETIIIDGRFNGPPESGNGGYVCGLVGTRIDGPAEVTLRRPPPLDVPLTLTGGENGSIFLRDGESLVAEGRPAAFDLETPQPPSYPQAEAAVPGYAGFENHVYPTCFVCGPHRSLGYGLRVFAGPVAGRDLVAAPWTPDERLAGEGGFVRPEFLWAVLDCPGYFALPDIALRSVLGRMVARIESRPQAGQLCLIAGWPIAQDGRKHTVGTALFTDSGNLCALARSTWIELR
jgi:hypothetical protein